jgi:bacterioferritin-associated ferredoxin
MYVCVCKAVSDSKIRRLVNDGATTLREVARETGLGSCCGKCVPQAREVLATALSAQPIRLADLVSLPLAASAAI